jgi:cytoskeletal protein RodZ
MISLGEALLNERKQRNITIEAISQKTNISVKALQAIENDQFKQLPGKFYLKNYIKSYLKAIGCDEKTFCDIHSQAINVILANAQEKTKSYYTKLKYSRFKKKNILNLLLITAFVVVVLTLLYVYKDIIFGERYAKLRPGDITGNETGLSFFPPTDSNVFSLDFWPIQVDIEFLDDCWMQVHRGSQKVIEQVFKRGEKTKLKGYEFHFTIGNPSAVKFYLNNQEITYLNNLSRSERLSIHPANIKQILER